MKLLALLALIGAVTIGRETPDDTATPRLPWPHQRPNLSEEARRQLVNSVFVINNFGAYAAGQSQEQAYFHDGIDIVLPERTPIFAVADGIVRVAGGVAPNGLVVIEDADRPGWGWWYVHVSAFRVRVGDRVTAGTELAGIDFPNGLQHLHLSRGFMDPGDNWRSFATPNYVEPLSYFDYVDDTAPVVEKPFRYFPNQSNREIIGPSPLIVSGSVDIVAGMRDGGAVTRGLVGRTDYGESHVPIRAEVSIASIASPNAPLWRHAAFDFSKTILRWWSPDRLNMPEIFYTLFKWRPLLASAPPGNQGRTTQYLILTNRGANHDGLRRFDPSDAEPAWQTDAVDTAGRRIFPDGEYIVTVTATDVRGNTTTERDRVLVRNNP